MAIIRDAAGNVFNIPDDELKKYLVSVATPGGKRPGKLCLEPILDLEHGPHDGWSYVEPFAKPKRTVAGKSKKKKK